MWTWARLDGPSSNNGSPFALGARLPRRTSITSLIAAASAILFLAGCSSGQQTSGRSKAPPSTGIDAQVARDLPGWQCMRMSSTSPEAIAADIAANHNGKQFGNGSPGSGEANFHPESSSMDGNPYAEFQCAKGSRSDVLWYSSLGGANLPLNPGLPSSGSLVEQSTRLSVNVGSSQGIASALATTITSVFAPTGTPTTAKCYVSDAAANDYFCTATNSANGVTILVLYHVDPRTGTVVSLRAAGDTGNTGVPLNTGGAQSGSSGLPTTSSTSSSATAASAGGGYPIAALNTYWRSIASHQYSAAYAELVPGSVGLTESQFVVGERQSGVQSASFSGHVSHNDSSVATVDVDSLTTHDTQFGCRSWAGSYQLSHRSGRWLIARASISPSSCG